MITEKDIARINELYHKSKAEGLSEAEKEEPADKTERQHKQFHLVTLHHLHALLHGIGSTDFLVVLQDVFYLREHHGGDDAWDDEENTADDNCQNTQEPGQEDAHEILVTVEETLIADVLVADQVEEVDGESPSEGQTDELPESLSTNTHGSITQRGDPPTDTVAEGEVYKRQNSCCAPLAL